MAVWEYDTVIFVAANGGLANRLRALVGYDALCRLRGCRLYVYWRPDVACEAAFTDLFEPSGLTVVTDDEASTLLQSKRTRLYHTQKWFSAVWRDDIPDVPRAAFFKEVRASLDRLTPTQAIADAAAAFRRERALDGALGVHIRHTDNVEVYTSGSHESQVLDRHKMSTVDGFIGAIGAHIDRMPVFLATDNARIERQCHEIFGDRLVTYPKHYACEWEPPAYVDRCPPLRTTAVSEALVEMLLLRSCRRIVGTYFSSFSKFAALWGRVEYLEMIGGRPQSSAMVDRIFEEFRACEPAAHLARDASR